MHSHFLLAKCRPKGARFFQTSRLEIEKRIIFWSPVCYGQDNFLFSDNSSPNELWISIFNDKVFLLVQLELPIIQSELFCGKFTSDSFPSLPPSKIQIPWDYGLQQLQSAFPHLLMHLVSGGCSRSFSCWQGTVCSNTANVDSRIPIPIPEAIRCWSVSGPHV